MKPRDRRLPAQLGLASVLAMGGVFGFRSFRSYEPILALPAYDAGQTKARMDGNFPHDEFGCAVVGCGDLDGDGRPEIMVGSPWESDAHSFAGAFEVFHGRDGSLLRRRVGPTSDVALGYGLAAGHDLDGDGVGDLLVGGTMGGPASGGVGGAVFVYSGARGEELRRIAGKEEHDEFGHALDFAGDLDGDGVSEWIIGAPGDWKGRTAGRVVLVGGACGTILREWTGNGRKGNRFGFSVAGGLDVCGDGVPDIAIGALEHDGPEGEAGTVFVMCGRTGDELLRVAGDRPGDKLGQSLDLIPDCDGDGRADLVVGSFRQQGVGHARVLSGVDGSTLVRVETGKEADCFGHTVCHAGDVDGDGQPDFAVGAPWANRDHARKVGAVWVYGARDGRPILEHRGDRVGGQLGYVVKPAGDVDGDGRDDVIAGSSEHRAMAGFVQIVGLPVGE